MRKLSLDLDQLQVESFRTDTDAASEPGTVHAHGGSFLSGGAGECFSQQASVCVCDTTHTQRAPECDPSAETFCIGTACDGGW